MGFWGRVGLSRVEHFSYQCKRLYSQIYGNSMMNDTSRGSKVGILGRAKPSELFAVKRSFAALIKPRQKAGAKDQKWPRLNDAITAESIRLVTDEGHSIVSRWEALNRAKNLKLDLVEVNRKTQPPVCKIMDFHKELYQQHLKEKERAKSKKNTLRKGDCKEVRFTGKIEQKDLKMKADMVKRLIERGYRVKYVAMGSEEEDLGALLSRLTVLIEDVAYIESGPRVEQRLAYAVVRHIKFGSKKNPGKKASKVVANSGKDGQKDSTSSTTSAGTISSETSSQIEEWGLSESDSETEDEILSDEDGAKIDSSEALLATSTEGTDKEIGENTTWSISDAGDEFKEVFGIDGPRNTTNSGLADSGIVNSVNAFQPQQDTFDLSKILPKKPPAASVGREPKCNQIQELKRNMHVDNPALRQITGGMIAKPTFEQNLREFKPDKFPSFVEPSHASGNWDRRSGTPGAHNYNSKLPLKAFESSQEPFRGQTNRLPNVRLQPRPFNSPPSTTQNVRNNDNISPKNLKPPSVGESQNHAQVEMKQGPSLSSYGIFSAPRTAATSDQRVPTKQTREKTPSSSNNSTDQSEQKTMTKSQDFDKSQQGGWGIFSQKTPGLSQNGNMESDSQVGPK